MDVLDGLDDIDWKSLEHAYGSAADVPDQLRDLVSGDETRIDAPNDPPGTWWFWSKQNGDASNVARDFGIPRDRWLWQQWLGLPRNGGQDSLHTRQRGWLNKLRGR